MRYIRKLALVCAGILMLTAQAAGQSVPDSEENAVVEATPDGNSTFVINLRETEIRVLAEQVATITGRTLILEPGVSGEVTVFSTEPLDADGVWELFQAVLRSKGFAAVRSGATWRVVAQAAILQGGASFNQGEKAASQDLVTRLVLLKNLPSDAAAKVLRPLVASFGYLEALQRPNAVVITDYAENVRRVESLARTLDSGQGAAFDNIQLQYATARDVAQVIERLVGDQSVGGSGIAPKIAIDERSNVLLVRADQETLDEIRRLARSLDKPGSALPTTQVFRLKHSDAEVVAEILRGVIGAPPTVDNPVASSVGGGRSAEDSMGAGRLNNFDRSGRGAPANPLEEITSGGAVSAKQSGGAENASGFSVGDLAIQPAPTMNAIVVRGTPTVIAEISALITELDVRRPQVLIEAAIVEITGDLSEQLGVQFATVPNLPEGVAAGTSFSDVGLSLKTVLAAIGSPAAAGMISEGLSAGFGIDDNFGILVQALAESTKANLLSTPSITTLDNQPAEIVVGQNVPFRTGSFQTPGATLVPFTTIEREDVGITLRVVPRVHEGDVVKLEVSQEVSSLVGAAVAGAADLITNRRSIQTTVLADNRETIVLGGLITDDRISVESKVPILGDIPLLGKLFGAETQTRTKRTLFVFLRPSILRSREDMIDAAQEKYRKLRGVERESDGGSMLFEGKYKKLPPETEGIY